MSLFILIKTIKELTLFINKLTYKKMQTETIFPRPINFNKNRPFDLEFSQLKEYYNFQRRFKSDKKNMNIYNKWNQNKYFLINIIWLNKWKELVNYSKFHSMHLNRDMNDNDYNTFINFLSQNEHINYLSPLDNSNIYTINGEINPFADFIIVDKSCYEIFKKSRENMVYNVMEKSIPVKILKDKIIFDIGFNIKIICYPDNIKKLDEEIIIIFKELNNKDTILSDIEKEDFKLWLQKRNFDMNSIDPLNICEKGCLIQIINRALIIKRRMSFQKNRINQKTTRIDENLMNIRFNLPNDLKTKIGNQVQDIVKQYSKEEKIQNQQIRNNIFQTSFQPNNNFNFVNNECIQANYNQMNQFHINQQNLGLINNNINNYNNINNKLKINENLDNMNNINFNSFQNLNNKLLTSKMHNVDLIKKDSFQNPLIKGITFPHKAKLEKTSQSIYINAVINCLSNIKGLSKFLLKQYVEFDLEKQPLCVSYSNLLYELFHTKEPYIKIDLFYQICEKLNPIFSKKNEKEIEAKDFLLFIMNSLHKELLPINKDNNSQIEDIDSYDEKKAHKSFLKKYDSNKTIISDIFYGIYRDIITCNICKESEYFFEIFNILFLYYKKVKEYKDKKFKGINSEINIYDAFFAEIEEQRLEGKDMIFCKKCKKLNKGIYKNDIYGLSKILIIVLDKGKNNQYFNEGFKIDEILDFTDKNLIINKNSYKKFYLSGIISLIEGNKNEINYIAYSRNNVNDNFICYNDTNIILVNTFEVVKNKITNNNEKEKPYILFYHYMK